MTLWLREGDEMVSDDGRRVDVEEFEARRAFTVGEAIDRDAYEISDPKHPDHHDVFSAIADDR